MNPSKSVIHFKIFYGLLMAAMITLPFTIFFMLPIALMLLVNFILEGNWKNRYKRFVSSKSVFFFIILSSIFLVYLLGLIYSSHLPTGLSSLETKLWFLIAPLIIFSSHREYLTKERCNKLIFTFIISCTVMVLGNICYSFIQYFTIKSVYYFFYIRATHFPYYHPVHPSYLAMYLTFSSVAILYFIFISKTVLKRWVKNIFIISLPLFVIFIYLLQSKAGILVFILVFFSCILYIINYKKTKIGVTVLFIFFTFFFTFCFFRFVPHPINRMGTALNEIYSGTVTHNRYSQNNGEDDAEPNSVTSRIHIWKIASKLTIQNMPFGVGTGDVNHVLQQEYLKCNQTKIYNRKLNAHNQYLQTTLALGIFGLAALISFFLIPTLYGIRHKKSLYLAFIMIVLPHLFVESMFERGAGANFIALFSVLLCYYSMNETDKLSTDNTRMK